MHLRPQGQVQLSDPGEKDCHYIQYLVHPVHTTLFYLIHLPILRGASLARPAHWAFLISSFLSRFFFRDHLVPKFASKKQVELTESGE